MKLGIRTLLWFALAALYFVFVTVYERQTRRAIGEETQRFAALLEIHLWNYDTDAAQDYLNIIERSRDYTALEIRHADGRIFAAASDGSRLWRLDDLLLAIGLQTEKTIRIPLFHRGNAIGDLVATWRNRNIYLHLNVLLLLILIVSVANYSGKVAGQGAELDERRRVESALRQSEAKWRSLVENAPDIILTLDRDMRLTYVNRGDYGFDPTQLIGKKITDIFPSPNASKGIAAFTKVLHTGEPTVYEADFLDPRTGLQRFFSARMGPILEDGRVEFVLMIVTEISDRKRRDAELQKAKADAEKANRLKTDFLANMSHEIRTPLNVILGYSSLVEKFARKHLPDERSAYFDYIRSAGHRLMDTIQKIVDISRFHIEDFPYSAEPVLVNALLADCVQQLRILADQKQLQLDYVAPAEEIWANFDRYALQQACINIIENAIKYTERGRIDVGLEADPNRIAIAVRDTGIGIGQDYLPNIFDEFSQEEGGYSRSFEGTGLGMALVKKFMTLGDGEVEIASQKGKGTTVTLTLARAPCPELAAPPPATFAVRHKLEPATALPKDKPNVLVVEDDLLTQAFMRTALGDDYNVDVAATSAELEAAIARRRPDLVLMDLSLRGGEDGLALTKQLRKRPELETLPIVALTAHALDADRDNALASGCSDYLAKPCPLDDLLETVARHTRRL